MNLKLFNTLTADASIDDVAPAFDYNFGLACKLNVHPWHHTFLWRERVQDKQDLAVTYKTGEIMLSGLPFCSECDWQENNNMADMRTSLMK